MDPNNIDEYLPSYEDVMRGRQRNYRSWFLRCFTFKSYLCLNSLLSIFTITGFLLIRYTDTIPVHFMNVTQYCNDHEYSRTAPTPSYYVVKRTIITTFVIYYIFTVTKSKLENCTTVQLVRTVIWNTWLLAAYLMFMVTQIEILKCVVGMPYPYFFSYPEILNMYCGNKRQTGNVASSLEKLDISLRRSFPSLRSAIYAFCTTFLYLYLDHFDIEVGLHAMQQLVILIMGSWLTYVQFWSWDNGENHFNDILVGAAIGILQAMLTARAIFGSVFHSRRVYIQKTTIIEMRPSAPPTPPDDEEAIQPLAIRNYESAETIAVDNAIGGGEVTDDDTSSIELVEVSTEEESRNIAETAV